MLKVLTLGDQVLKYYWNHSDLPEIAFCFSSATIHFPINLDTVYSNENILSDKKNKFAQATFLSFISHKSPGHGLKHW